MIIGITGGIGCGKSTLSRMLAMEVNADLLTVDIISKRILLFEKVVWTEVHDKFLKAGFDVSTGDEYYPLDTDKLRNIIFDHDDMRITLENILLPHVKLYISSRLEFYTGENFIVDSALLFESGLNEYCDVIVLVTTQEENQLERASLRDTVNESQIAKIMSKQMSVAKRKTLLADNDFIVENNSTIEDLERTVKIVAKNLLERYSQNETT